MKFLRIQLSRTVTLSFLGNAVDQHWPWIIPGIFKGLQQGMKTVAVNGPNIANTEFLKKDAGEKGLLKQLFKGPGTFN